MKQWLHELAERALNRFAIWFASEGGAYQTTAICIGAVTFEIFDRRADPHAFLLMAVLTVYSAITQPMLAYTSNLSAIRVEQLLVDLERLRERDEERSMLQLQYLLAWHHETHGDTCMCWQSFRDAALHVLDAHTSTETVPIPEMV